MTLGHSTRAWEEFLNLLHHHGVETIVDVRTIPKSRHNPQFNAETMRAALADASLRYVHEKDLGGHRKPRTESLNAGWRNESFRGYADHMGTPAFADAIKRLLALATRERVAILCAEAVPWRCHRSLIADALMVRGARVENILTATKREPHKITPFARVDGTAITYPEPAAQGVTKIEDFEG